MQDEFVKFALWGIAAPAVVAAVAVLLPRIRPLRARIGEVRLGPAVAISAGYLAGHLGLKGRPPFPAIETQDWLPWLALAALAVGLVDAARSWPRRARGAVALVAWGGVVALMLRPLVLNTWDRGESAWTWAGTAAGLSAVLFAAWVSLDVLARTRPAAALAPTLVVVAAGEAAALVLSHSAILGQLGVAAAMTLGPCLLLAWWDPAPSLGRAAVPVLLVILAGLAMVAHYYADMTTGTALALAIAPAAAWVAALGPIRRLSPRKAGLIAAALAIVPVALALYLCPSGSGAGGSTPEDEIYRVSGRF